MADGGADVHGVLEDDATEADLTDGCDGRDSPNSEPEDSAAYAGIEADFDSFGDPDYEANDLILNQNNHVLNIRGCTEADLQLQTMPVSITHEERLNHACEGNSGENQNSCNAIIINQNIMASSDVERDDATASLQVDGFLGIEADFDSSVSHPSPVHVSLCCAASDSPEEDLEQMIARELGECLSYNETGPTNSAPFAEIDCNSKTNDVESLLSSERLNTEDEFYQPECDQGSDQSCDSVSTSPLNFTLSASCNEDSSHNSGIVLDITNAHISNGRRTPEVASVDNDDPPRSDIITQQLYRQEPLLENTESSLDLFHSSNNLVQGQISSSDNVDSNQSSLTNDNAISERFSSHCQDDEVPAESVLDPTLCNADSRINENSIGVHSIDPVSSDSPVSCSSNEESIERNDSIMQDSSSVDQCAPGQNIICEGGLSKCDNVSVVVEMILGLDANISHCDNSTELVKHDKLSATSQNGACCEAVVSDHNNASDSHCINDSSRHKDHFKDKDATGSSLSLSQFLISEQTECVKKLVNHDVLHSSMDASFLNEINGESDTISSPRETESCNGSELIPNSVQSTQLSEVPDCQHLLSQLEILQKNLDLSTLNEKRLQAEKIEGSALLKEVAKERDDLRSQLQAFQTKSSDDVYLAKIKGLEFTIAQQQKDIKQTKDKLASHDAAAKRAVGTLQNELKLRVDQVTKMYEDCLREKDSMVVKYAQAEQKNLEIKRQLERAEAKIKECIKDRDTAINRYKNVGGEKNRILSQLQSKHQETILLSREMEKLKESLSSADVKVKWANNKLKAEADQHQETKIKVEKLQQKLKEAKEETEQIRRDCQDMVKTYQESEEIKSVSLALKVREKDNELKTQLQDNQDQEEVYRMVAQELDSIKRKHKDAVEEIKTFKDKVLCLEQERLDQEQIITQYKDICQKQKVDNKEIGDKLKYLHNIEELFDAEKEESISLQSQIDELHQAEKDRVTDVTTYQTQNMELLNLTQKLTEKNAFLQSENSSQNQRLTSLTSEVERLTLLSKDQAKHIDILSRDLSKEKKAHDNETKDLTAKLCHKTQEADELKTRVEEEKDENRTLKRRNTASIKDLTRQLQQARRRLEVFENQPGTEKDSMSIDSRTSSSGSLDTLSNGHHQNSRASSHEPSPPQDSAETNSYTPTSTIIEPDRQMLIERIVKLQKAHARKNDKIEFMEEHNQQILVEIKKKNRVIQHYMLRDEVGALAPESMDIVKAQMAKRGGIMASLYNHSTDGAMSLELSLEIGRKLQAVVEDTLLKNMTLKENIDTLGAEIARLSQENRNLQLSLRKT